MEDPCRPLRQLARNARLANARLHRACERLQPGEWEARRVSFFPSLKATLNHIFIVDRFYLDAAEGGKLGLAAWEDEEPFATIAELAEAQATLDRQAVALCEGLQPQDLAREVQLIRKDRVQRERLDDVLMHLFLHDQHHRGQVHAMLSGTSVAPPQLDEFFMADEVRYRVGDLAAEGWDEARLRQ